MLVVIRQWFKQVDFDFIDENGGGPGVHLRKRQGREDLRFGPHFNAANTSIKKLCFWIDYL